MEWREDIVGNYITIKHGFAFKGEYFSDEGEYIVLTPGNIQLEGGIKLTGKEKSYTEEFPQSFIFEEGDLVVVMTDLIQDAPILGGALLIPESNKFLHNQRLGKVEIKGEVDKKFLYYYLNSEYYRGQVRGTATGATVRHTAPERIYQCKINLPPPPIQRRVAEVLGRYDELIENYQRQIGILEALAQALYREWFVRGRCQYAQTQTEKLPVGWRRVNLFDIASITYGFPFDSTLFNEEKEGKPIVRIRDIVNSDTNTYTTEEPNNRYLLSDGDILVGMDGDFYIAKWSGGEAYLNQRVLRLEPKNEEIPRYFLYHSIQAPIHFFNSVITGTTVAHLSDSDLKKIEIMLPDTITLRGFKKITDPIYEKEINLKTQITILRQMRDKLLPRLMSGQIPLTAAE